ncbi:SCAN domain-containing protein 3 [Trichonephila clavipes]|nr:SCAN domain-containing protein 3 [Trichonephila clavipes]
MYSALRHGGTLNSCRDASPLAWLVEGKRGGRPQGFLTLNWDGIEQNHTVTCMKLKVKTNGHFDEEMLFCKRLESTTTSKDIFIKLKNCLDVNDIPMKNRTSCAADGAPNMMDKKNGCLKFMKDANPEMILVHCVIHRQNLVAKNISSVLNEVLHTVIKCVIVIKASAKCEGIFKIFCEEQNEDHVRLYFILK